MSIAYTENHETKTVEFVVSGYVSREDYESVIGPMQDFIDACGTVKMLEIVESFQGFAPSILIPGLRFDIRNLRHISRLAVVSDIGWFSPLAKTVGAVISTRLQMFALADLEKARMWLADDD